MRTEKKYLRKEMKNTLGERYEILKKEMFAQRDSETLVKYKILKEAYEIGKKMETRFSMETLAEDFEIGLTTVKRLLSLDRASKKTWGLIKEGKISAYKVAQICSTKNRHFQEEIVDMVVKQELSTYDIKTLKPEGIDDLNEYRFQKAVKKGYSREDSAFINFKNTLYRLKTLLLMDIENLPQNKMDELFEKLEDIKDTIKKYLRINKKLKDKKE